MNDKLIAYCIPLIKFIYILLPKTDIFGIPNSLIASNRFSPTFPFPENFAAFKSVYSVKNILNKFEFYSCFFLKTMLKYFNDTILKYF